MLPHGAYQPDPRHCNSLVESAFSLPLSFDCSSESITWPLCVYLVTECQSSLPFDPVTKCQYNIHLDLGRMPLQSSLWSWLPNVNIVFWIPIQLLPPLAHGLFFLSDWSHFAALGREPSFFRPRAREWIPVSSKNWGPPPDLTAVASSSWLDGQHTKLNLPFHPNGLLTHL